MKQGATARQALRHRTCPMVTELPLGARNFTSVPLASACAAAGASKSGRRLAQQGTLATCIAGSAGHAGLPWRLPCLAKGSCSKGYVPQHAETPAIGDATCATSHSCGCRRCCHHRRLAGGPAQQHNAQAAENLVPLLKGLSQLCSGRSPGLVL